MTDGSTLVEQELVRERQPDRELFRYLVWDYTSESANAIQYGVGEFIHTAVGANQTHVRWTYSFARGAGR